MDTTPSPMMAQWHACKKSAPNALLLFRLGDFYEAFYEDALILARELEITLTKRQEVPMAGVPFHASEAYIDKLVAKGHRVAIAEQMEDPRATKGIVRREVVRTITPGTAISSTLLSDKSNHFLAAITQVGATFGLALLDLSTATFRAMEFSEDKGLIDALCRLSPKELLLSEKWKKQHPDLLIECQGQFHPAVNVKPDWHFDHAHASSILLRHFDVLQLDGFGLTGMVAAINAAGAILEYVRDDLNLAISHIQTLTAEHPSDYMLLDRATQRHLELFTSLHEGKKSHSLLHFLDRTKTPMGARTLKHYLMYPLLSPEEIKRRQDGVEELLTSHNLSTHLAEIRDLERLIMRIETGYATPRDVAGLRFSLEHVTPLAQALAPFSAQVLQAALGKLAPLDFLVEKIQTALIDTPPLRLSDGEIFRKGYSEELDALTSLKTDSQDWIARYQTHLKETTQIKTLKVGYTKAFGFYIEVSRGQADRIPDTFQRRQTLVNAERFITPELKDYEHKMLHAEERISALEIELFTALRKEIAAHAATIRQIAQAVAEIDALASLASIAKEYSYVRPSVNLSTLFHIEGGRHPVIESTLPPGSFVPNDVTLNAESQRLYLITGPNMAGKSTYIRQAALIAILAQMGSFVPAKSAQIGIIDKVFSRIGASDDLSRGQSTFMVEMTETANILHGATDRSLVLLDEIGRGTSTYDGISIAWAVAEYLLTCPGKQAKTLFATHYWELTELEKLIPGAVNYNVAVHESERGIVFLHKIVKGGTDKSYGIHVARLAGLPSPVIKRALEMLAKLEKGAGKGTRPKPVDPQLSLFSLSIDPLREAIKTLDPHHLTPMQALETLIAWKNRFAHEI
ncbi:MAG: DNA mismatch repair protein MutS [Verrucomicrobia bacterium]|nr:DNA mismatch repair protein MutS [Verrucomicrobiota bacterium]